MTYGAIQTAYADRVVRTAGVIQRPELCDIDSTKMLYTADGSSIGMGVVVSRRTGYEDKQIVPGGTNVLGITVRAGASGALTDNDNTAVWEYQRQGRVLKSGLVAVPTTGTGTAGTKVFSYNTTTGAIKIGTPGAGEARLFGLTLEDNVATSGAVALVTAKDVTADPEFVYSVTVNGSSVVTDNVAAIDAVTSIQANADAALVGDVTLTDTGTVTLTTTDNNIDVAGS